MPNFDDAMNATEEMFTNQPAVEEEPIVEETVEPPVEEAVPPTEPTPEDATLNDAVNTAEVAAQVAQEKEAQLQQALQQIEELQSQHQQMQGMIDELSNKNEENLIEEAMLPPTLDINGLAFADEDTIEQAQAEYAQKMAAYNRKQFEEEYKPVLDFAKKGMQEEERARVLSDLSEAPELQGIQEMMPQIERIIANNKWLQSGDMPLDEKYVNAYAIARGVNAINTPPPEPQKELTSEELMQLYESNPTFQELVEKKRLDAIKNSQQVPPFSASSGAVNAALNIKEKPKTFEEASERTRKWFGL